MDKPNEKKVTTVKKTPSMKSESETQTAVAVRVPSIKRHTDDETRAAVEKLVTDEQVQNASVARKRRIITKSKAQGIRTREKTPEPSKASIPHEDTTTTDDDDPKSSKPPVDEDADDIYAEMRKMIEQKKTMKDDDDIDIDAIREQQAEEMREKRRRSISPFAIPTKEELAALRRKGSFVDPGNKLLSTVPNYAITPKDESVTPPSRKGSLIVETDLARKNSLTLPNNPVQPDKNLITPPPSPNKSNQGENFPPSKMPPIIEKTSKMTQPTKPASVPATTKVSDLKTSTNNVSNISTTIKPQQPISKPDRAQPPSAEVNDPPVKPKRSKSGTRSQGRTSESEMSEDQTKKIPQPPQHLQQRTPKPRERRRTIAAIKRSVRERPQENRSRSATRPELDATGIEMTKTTTEIISLLQKAQRRSLSIPEDDLKTSIVSKNSVDISKQLMTPNRTPATPIKIKRATTPKTIEVLSEKDALESFRKAQRKSLEIERSRHSSGYIDASQSELTSSCYSSSYSEDESDFDLSKKSVELQRKLRLLHMEKEAERMKSETVRRMKGKKEEKKVEKIEPPKISYAANNTRKEIFKAMCKNFFVVLRDFRKNNQHEMEKIRELRNKCFTQLFVMMIFCGLGGVVFRYTEGAFENLYKCGVRRVKRDFIDTLWQGSYNMKEEDWKSMARNKLWEFENQLHTAHEAGVRSYSGQKAWSFLNSVLFCLTIVTTIGYGHITPSTPTGRIITIVYAIIGIPLFLILLADFGKLFTRCLKFLWAFVRRLYYTGSCRKVRKTTGVQEVMKGINLVYEAASTLRRPSQFAVDEEAPTNEDENKPPKLPPKPKSSDKQEADDDIGSDAQTPAPSVFEIDDEFNLPISIAIVCLIVYIFIGAAVYNIWEPWNFFESFYFVFISMSTIGFGDFVPNHPMFMMCTIVYLVFGMALTSMCINVVQVKLSDSFRQASAKIGATIGLKVCEEDGSLAPMTPGAEGTSTNQDVNNANVTEVK